MRISFASITLLLLLLTPLSATSEITYYRLDAEPLIRIGLSTNSTSVRITTNDSTLVSFSPDEPMKTLASNRVTVAARVYRPAEVETFRVEFQGLPSQTEAAAFAKEIRDAIGISTVVGPDPAAGLWKVTVGTPYPSPIEADEVRAKLAEKGFEDAVIVGEKSTPVSPEAAALSAQIGRQGPSEVRSLVTPIGSTQPTSTTAIAPNLREVTIDGLSPMSKYSSLKAVSFGSLNERANPVQLNGKAYRGKIEVFVNARGTLTVVNVVPLEEYLLGVVPAELGLPQLEAQKAQAVAARTYAVANIGRFGKQGFDMVPTVWSQVYKGVSIENRMGTMAVQQTRGVVATHNGKPIMAYYTSTCGGRTESSENIFDHAEPYLVGVECSLEGQRHFQSFLIKTSRTPAKLRDDANLELVRTTSILAANGLGVPSGSMSDEWFEDVPTESEMANWLALLAVRFNRPAPTVGRGAAMPVELAKLIAGFVYQPGAVDTLLTESDINYHLSFDDAREIPRERRAEIAALLRDGLMSLHPDLTFKPNRPFSRARMIRLISQIFEKRKWTPAMLTAKAKATADGKLVLTSGRTERQITIRPDVFLFREFGGRMYPVAEAAIIGGEQVSYQLDALGSVKYIEISPTDVPVTAENASPWINWNKTLSAGEAQARLSRYVRGIGTLYDINVKKVGYSRRPVELEIIGSNGVKVLKGGKIRSALRLNEQLFVMNKRYAGDRVASYTFTGRGWGHGVGMCQYGAFGLAKMGVKYDEIIKHYYSGVELTRAY
jgi:stage II sporulation protein D